jgi:hypothetical protein
MKDDVENDIIKNWELLTGDKQCITEMEDSN